MTHTPGPWRVTSDGFISSESHGFVPLITPFNERAFVDEIGQIKGSVSHTPEEILSNARLIAAAPDLLDACKSILARLENLTTEEYSKGGDKAAREQLAAAIAKAEGQ